MTSEQLQHQRAASTNRTMLASLNHGRPDVAASTRPEPLGNRPAAPHNRAANTERPATSKPAARPEPAPKSAPSRAEHYSSAAPTPASSRPAPTPAHPSTPTPSSRPAPANPDNRPTHHSTPAAKPAAPQSETSVTHKQTSKPVPRFIRRLTVKRATSEHRTHSSASISATRGSATFIGATRNFESAPSANEARTPRALKGTQFGCAQLCI